MDFAAERKMEPQMLASVARNPQHSANALEQSHISRSKFKRTQTHNCTMHNCQMHNCQMLKLPKLLKCTNVYLYCQDCQCQSKSALKFYHHFASCIVLDNYPKTTPSEPLAPTQYLPLKLYFTYSSSLTTTVEQLPQNYH